MKRKSFKAFVCIVMMLVLGVTTLGTGLCAKTADTGADDGVMRTNLTATLVSEEMGIGINLGNTMEAYWLDGAIRKSGWIENGRIDSGAQTIGSNTSSNYETCWGAVVTTQKAIDGMKAAGFNTVRIPVYWGNMMIDDGTFTINSEYIARVKEIVDYCRNNDMYVVINIHHYDEFLIRRYAEAGTLEECAETFKILWTQIAEYFKDYSDYLVFEGFNEYLGGGPYKRDASGNVLTDEWGNPQVTNLSSIEAYKWTNTLNQAFVDAVRATGGNNEERVLIVSGYWTNIDNTTSSDFKMPSDTVKNRLMVSVHYVDNAMYWTNKIGSTEWQDYSVSQCEKLKKAFTDNGIPVFVGECTASYSSDRFSGDLTGRNSAATLDYMLRLIKSYGFTPVIWDTSNNFYSRTNATISSTEDAAVIKALADELSGNESSSVTPTNAPTMAPEGESEVSGAPASSDKDNDGNNGGITIVVITSVAAAAIALLIIFKKSREKKN